MIRRHRWFFAVAALWVAIGPRIAELKAEDFQVNTYTTSTQWRPAVAMDASGNFVVVWDSLGSGGTDSSEFSVQGQLYAADGAPLGGELQINTYTTSSQAGPAVAMDEDGDFVVAWLSVGSPGTDSSGYSVQARRYAADGSPLGDQFQVNTITAGNQFVPSVAMSAAGDFVVVWDSEGSSGTDTSSRSIQAQRYAADGTPLGGELQVNSYTTNSQRYPFVAMDAAGDFVVVWESYGSSGTDASSWSVQAQRYAADGTPAGGELQVNTYTTGSQIWLSVATDEDGDFVVVWTSYGSGETDASSWSVHGRRYAADGTAAGGQFQVNTYTTSSQLLPSVAMAANGDFVVVWDGNGSSGTDSSSRSVQAQRYAADGSPAGGELQVNTYTTSSQREPAVAMDPAGDFVVAWTSYGSGGTDTSGDSVQGRRFEAPDVGCKPDATTLCLPEDDRFEVTIDIETVQGGGHMGSAQAIPLDSIEIEKGGIFAFGDPANPELLVKVLDGCAVNGHYWVFYAATTNVGFEVTVTDTATDETRVYTNPDLNPALTVTDTLAFATCP